MKIEKVYIDQDFIKLDSLLKFGGVVPTGGQAKVLVQSGKVYVNGKVCTERGKKIHVGDQVQNEDKILEVYRK
ncbi:MAG: RNA-binding S4 domain-containing protein [Acutalibacteraceae bacterium]|nr:RNA-binding S4 domain-containing protein [Acutalibacteraceae bacterium]